MYATSYQRYKYSADLYKFVVKSVGQEQQIEYYFAKRIALVAGLDDQQRMFVRSEEIIAPGSLLKDVRDADGKLILDDSQWQITTTTPVLNAFNNVESYRMKAIQYLGDS